MIMVNVNERKERKEFAEEAATYFYKHPNKTTYTSEEIKAGELFALRFGMGDDCVVVFRLDENQDVENYQNIISRQ